MPWADLQQQKSVHAISIVDYLFSGLPGADFHTNTQRHCLGDDKSRKNRMHALFLSS